MHKSSFHKMKQFCDTYLERGKSYRVLDIGGYGEDYNDAGLNHSGSYANLFHGSQYETLNPENNPNTTFCVKEAYNWKEVPDNYADVVISGQTLEHVPFFWITMLEIHRVLKPGGLVCIIVPSGGEEHKYPLDCYRFYNDGMAALAESCGLEVLEVKTDYVYEGIPPHWLLGVDETGAYMHSDYCGSRFGDSVLIAKKNTFTESVENQLRELHKAHIEVLNSLQNINIQNSAPKKVVNVLPADERSCMLMLAIDTGSGFTQWSMLHNLGNEVQPGKAIFDLSTCANIQGLRLAFFHPELIFVEMHSILLDGVSVEADVKNAAQLGEKVMISNDSAYFDILNVPKEIKSMQLELTIGQSKSSVSDDPILAVYRLWERSQNRYNALLERVAALESENAKLSR